MYIDLISYIYVPISNMFEKRQHRVLHNHFHCVSLLLCLRIMIIWRLRTGIFFILAENSDDDIPLAKMRMGK